MGCGRWRDRRLVGEGGEQPAGDVGGDQRVAVGRRVDGLHEQLGPGVLEQEAAGAGAQRAEDVLIEVERGDHHDRHRVRHVWPGQAPRHLDAVEPGHPDVDEEDVGTQPGRQLDRARAPSAASPTTSRSGCAPRIITSPVRTSSWSSATTTRMVMPGASTGSTAVDRPAALGPRPRGERCRRGAGRARPCPAGRSPASGRSPGLGLSVVATRSRRRRPSRRTSIPTRVALAGVPYARWSATPARAGRARRRRVVPAGSAELVRARPRRWAWRRRAPEPAGPRYPAAGRRRRLPPHAGPAPSHRISASVRDASPRSRPGRQRPSRAGCRRRHATGLRLHRDGRDVVGHGVVQLAGQRRPAPGCGSRAAGVARRPRGSGTPPRGRRTSAGRRCRRRRRPSPRRRRTSRARRTTDDERRCPITTSRPEPHRTQGVEQDQDEHHRVEAEVPAVGEPAGTTESSPCDAETDQGGQQRVAPAPEQRPGASAEGEHGDQGSPRHVRAEDRLDHGGEPEHADQQPVALAPWRRVAGRGSCQIGAPSVVPHSSSVGIGAPPAYRPKGRPPAPPIGGANPGLDADPPGAPGRG